LPISVSAAANEYEGAQLVLHGGNAGLRGVDLHLNGPLSAGEGLELPATAVTFYREHYVTVTSPSEGVGEKGSYPDALVPFHNPFTGEPLGTVRIPAAPFDVPVGNNQPIYVEFFVPPGTAAGLYQSTLRVLLKGGVVFAEVPVSLTVRDFELPVASSHVASVQSNDVEHWYGPAKYYGYGHRGPEHKSVARFVDELLLGHRLTPSSPMGTGFEVSNSGQIVADSAKAAVTEYWMSRPEYGQFALDYDGEYPFKRPFSVNRQRTITFIQSAHAWFAERG
ncbi:MAG: hypothetical protein GY953_22635, partial [bacterium]|nr:hypothetical protein [bacterium]